MEELINKVWNILGSINKPPKTRLSEAEKLQINVNKYVDNLIKKGKSNRTIRRAVLRKFNVQLR